MKIKEQYNEDDEYISEKSKSNQRFVKISFLIFGIGGLLPWNAILSQLDFFAKYLSESFSPSV